MRTIAVSQFDETALPGFPDIHQPRLTGRPFGATGVVRKAFRHLRPGGIGGEKLETASLWVHAAVAITTLVWCIFRACG